MANFGFWMGIGAAQKVAGTSFDGKSTNRRRRAISAVVGILIALLIAAGLIVLLGTANNL
jgi:hypothetical protein